MSDDSLIMLHGWGMNAQVFAPLAAILGDRFSVHCPALPGYAGSRWPAAADFDAQLEQMAAELPPGELLGWSLGGLYAIELARRWPQRFERLTLVASNPCFVRRQGWDCALEASVFEGFSADLQLDWRRTLKRFLALQMQGEADARGLARDLWRQLVETGEPAPGVLEFGLELLGQRDARDALAEIEKPVRLILGEKDRLVPIALAQQIAELTPRIQVESVAGAAHAPFLSHTREFAALW